MDTIHFVNDHYEHIVNISKHNKNNLDETSSFYKDFYLLLNNFYNNCKQLGSKYSSVTTLASFVTTLNNQIESFNNNILLSSDMFKQSISITYDMCIDDMKTIILRLAETNKSLDRLKVQHSEVVSEIKLQRNKLEQGDFDSDEIEQEEDKHIILSSISQTIVEQIKYEIKIYNSNIIELNNNYDKIKEKLIINNQSKESFIKTQESKFSKIMSVISDSLINFSSKHIFIQKSIDYEPIDLLIKDECLLNVIESNRKQSFELFNLNNDEEIKNNQRESILKLNNRGTIISQRISLINLKTKSSNNLIEINSDINRIVKPRKSLETDYFLMRKLSDFDIEKSLLSFWNIIKGIQEIELSQLTFIINTIKIENISIKMLIELILPLNNKKLFYIKLQNKQNLYHLSNVFICMLISKKDDLNLVFPLIYLSERTFFEDESKNKIYLCYLMSKNAIFSSKIFWRKLFEVKLNSNIENEYKLLYPKLISMNRGSCIDENTKFSLAKRLSQINPENIVQQLTRLNHSSTVKEEKGFFKTLKGFFLTDDKVNKEVESSNDKTSSIDSIMTNSNFQKLEANMFNKKFSTIQDTHNFAGFIEDSSHSNNKPIKSNDNYGLNEYYKQNLDKIILNPNEYQKQLIEIIKIEEINRVIKTFINYFAYFSVESSEVIEFIIDITTSNHLPKEYLQYYITIIGTTYYTIKNNQISSIKKINLLKNMNSKSKSILFEKVMDYLDNQSAFNLILSEKAYLSNLKLKFDYKLSLQIQNETKIKNKLRLWENRLNTSNIRKNTINYTLISLFLNNLQEFEEFQLYFKKYESEQKTEGNYSLSKEEKQSLSNKFITNLNLPDIYDNFNIINLDVRRTYFSDDCENKRKAIKRILQAFVVIKNSKAYCQGMNSIVSFIYFLSQDEERTFYIFLSLYENTDFKLIFTEDLLKLKQFFYIFDRLLILYTPEINSYFYHNGLGSSFYCSSWFMTLFTGCFQGTDCRISNTIIRIWDEFIFFGWKSIIKSCILIFMSYEEIILSLKYDDSIPSLFNDIIKQGLLNEEWYTQFSNLWRKVIIPDDLLNNLENEYLQGLKIINFSERANKILGNNKEERK